MSTLAAPTVRRPHADTLARITGAALMLGVAYIHLLDLPGKMAEVPYLGYMYILLMVGSLLSAGLLFFRPRIGWSLGGALVLGSIIAFCLNRTVGLPYALEDIGNWGEPLGVASLVVEGMMVLLSATMLGLRRGAHQDGAVVTTE